MTKETKLRLYSTTSKAALECSTESWILKERTRQRLRSAPMKFLGALLGLATLDEIRNTKIREKLNTKNIVGKIEEYQSDCARRVERMRSTRVPQQQALTDQKERSGEPENKVEGPNSWRDQIHLRRQGQAY